MADVKHKVERAAFGAAIDGILKYVNKDEADREKAFLKLVDLSEKFMGDTFRKESYDAARRMIQDPDSKWMQYVNRILNEVDPHVIKMSALDYGFEAAFCGKKEINEMRVKHQCNIPWLILMDPTSACNLRCTGCWAAEYGHKLNLDLDTIDNIVKQGKKLGIYMCIYTGGEPLVRKKDLITLCERHPDCEFLSFTNGTLIDDAFCEEVKKVGNMAFFLSVEGLDDATDSRRGEGVFQRVMNAMDIMKKHGLLFGTSICYTSANYKAVTSDEFMDMLISHGVRFNWYFHYMPIGDGANVDLMLNPEQREYMIQRVREIRGFTGGKQIFCIDFQNDGEYIDGCIAGGRQYAHINPNGDVEPCVFIHYSGANIHDKSLLECLQQPLFKEYHKGQPFNGNHLRPCPMLENPQILGDMVRRSGAHSTDMQQPESPEDVFRRCRPYATSWMPTADRLWAEKHPGYVDPENPESANSCASCASCAACSAHQE